MHSGYSSTSQEGPTHDHQQETRTHRFLLYTIFDGFQNFLIHPDVIRRILVIPEALKPPKVWPILAPGAFNDATINLLPLPPYLWLISHGWQKRVTLGIWCACLLLFRLRIQMQNASINIGIRTSTFQPYPISPWRSFDGHFEIDSIVFFCLPLQPRFR